MRVPELPDFDVLMGPSLATSSSTQIIKGSVSSEVAYIIYLYIDAEERGYYNIGPASIKVKGANYTSNALAIKVLPPDKAPKLTEEEVSLLLSVRTIIL